MLGESSGNVSFCFTHKSPDPFADYCIEAVTPGIVLNEAGVTGVQRYVVLVGRGDQAYARS